MRGASELDAISNYKSQMRVASNGCFPSFIKLFREWIFDGRLRLLHPG